MFLLKGVWDLVAASPSTHLGCHKFVYFSTECVHMKTYFKNIDFCLVSQNACSMVQVAAAAAKSLQSCPTLCDPIDGSPPGSPVPGILQARTLEWVAIMDTYKMTCTQVYIQANSWVHNTQTCTHGDTINAHMRTHMYANI